MLPRVSHAESQHPTLCWKVPASVARVGVETNNSHCAWGPSGCKKVNNTPCTPAPGLQDPTHTHCNPVPPRATRPQQSTAPQECCVHGWRAGRQESPTPAQTSTTFLAGLSRERWGRQDPAPGTASRLSICLSVHPSVPPSVRVPLLSGCVIPGRPRNISAPAPCL